MDSKKYTEEERIAAFENGCVCGFAWLAEEQGLDQQKTEKLLSHFRHYVTTKAIPFMDLVVSTTKDKKKGRPGSERLN